MKNIVGYFVSRRFAVNSIGEQPKESILDFLLLHQDTINCFYHLSYNVAGVLWQLHLPKEQLEELYLKGETRLEPDYILYYITDRYFAVKKGNYWDCPYVQFCDISQYIPWKLQEEETLEDATNKAKQAWAIGKMVFDCLNDKVGLHKIDSMTSPVRAYEKGYLNHIDLPTVNDIPEDAGKYAYYSTHGGWFEAFQKGHFEQVYDYDIVAAYPYWTAQLPELRYGKWKQSKEYQHDAALGYMYGEVTIDKNFSPVIYNPKHDVKLDRQEQESTNFTPTGIWETYINKSTYEFIAEHSLGSFQTYDAWYWYPDHLVYPLKSTIGRLFRTTRAERRIRPRCYQENTRWYLGQATRNSSKHLRKAL